MRTQKHSRGIRILLAFSLIFTIFSFTNVSAIEDKGSLITKIPNSFTTTKTYHWNIRAHYIDRNNKDILIEDGAKLTLYGELSDGEQVEIAKTEASLNSITNNNIEFEFDVPPGMYVSYALYWNEPNKTVYVSQGSITPQRYNVIFNGNGGVFKGEVPTLYLSYLNHNKLSENTDYQQPTREGYSFNGWILNGKPWNEERDFVETHLTLDANWTKDNKYFTVFFNSLGGSDVDPYTGVLENTSIQEPSEPQRLNYSFGGWYRDVDLTIPWDFANDKVDSETTLYAEWILNEYRISFDTDGGSPQDDAFVKHGETLIRPNDPTKAGYIFVGWYYEADLWDFDSNTITTNLSLSARWEPRKLMVSFDTNGGSPIKSIDQITYLDTIDAPAVPNRFGYIFSGWYRDESLTEGFNFDNPLETDLVLYARWVGKNYSVRFEPQGGQGVRDLDAVQHGSLITHLETPVKKGYRFIGWYADLHSDVPFEFASTKIYQDTVLFARWERVSTEPPVLPKPRPDQEISMRPTNPPRPYVIPNSGNTQSGDLFITEEKKEELVVGKHPDIKKEKPKEVTPRDSEEILETLNNRRDPYLLSIGILVLAIIGLGFLFKKALKK